VTNLVTLDRRYEPDTRRGARYDAVRARLATT